MFFVHSYIIEVTGLATAPSHRNQLSAVNIYFKTNKTWQLLIRDDEAAQRFEEKV